MSFPRYPAYKKSGVEWVGEIPVGWEYCRLRFVAQFNPSKTEISYIPLNEEVSFLPMEAIGDDGTINLGQKRKISDVQNGYTYFRDMDVIFAKITPCFENGKGALAQGLLRGIGFGTTELIVARSAPSRVIPEYLLRFFQSDIFRKPAEASMYGAGGQKRVSESFVRDFSIPLPPLPEQQAIASFLDRECGKIDALIAEQERLIALLAEKRQAVISHAVTKGLNPNAPMKDSGIPWIGMVPEGWKVVKLKHIGRFFGGAGFPHEFQGNENLELGFYKVGDLSRSTDGVFMSLAQHTVTYETAEQLKANVIPRNSILYAKIGAALLLNRRRISPDKCCIDNNMTAFIPNIPVHVKWSFWWLSFIDFSRFVKPGTVPSLSEGDQKEIAALLPPDRELDSIIEYIEANVNRIDLLEKEISRGIFISKERRAALISAAVTGKIDVRAQSKALTA